MICGHHLSVRVKRKFRDTRVQLICFLLRKTGLGAQCDKGCFRRVTDAGISAIFALRCNCITTEYTGLKKSYKLCVRSDLGFVFILDLAFRCITDAGNIEGFLTIKDLTDCHFILSKSTGLICADNIYAAQRLNSEQAAYDRIFTCHLRHTERKNDSNYSGKAFRNSCNREADSSHKSIFPGLALSKYINYKDDQADRNTDDTEDLTEFCKVLLKRSLFIINRGKAAGDLTQFRIRTGFHDDTASASVGYRRTHVQHILSITDAAVFFKNYCRIFINRN